MMMKRRLLQLALVVVGLIVLYPAAIIARYKWFPPHYDVVSIATSPVYKDAALLERAWALPVAAQYRHRVDYQPNGSICGPTSVANTFRSLGEEPITPSGVVEGSGKCPLDFCWMGLSLDELRDVAARKTRHKVTLLR